MLPTGSEYNDNIKHIWYSQQALLSLATQYFIVINRCLVQVLQNYKMLLLPISWHTCSKCTRTCVSRLKQYDLGCLFLSFSTPFWAGHFVSKKLCRFPRHGPTSWNCLEYIPAVQIPHSQFLEVGRVFLHSCKSLRRVSDDTVWRG